MDSSDSDALDAISDMSSDGCLDDISSDDEQEHNVVASNNIEKDCIGAIDGTHIPASLPVAEQGKYYGRKGTPTQNCMVACDFDLCFTFVLPGWEGSAHDTRMFYDTIRDPTKGFPSPPPGKYYLVDAGYPNIPGYLAPYKGYLYHFQDFPRGARYNNQFETFNHMHSSLRTTIERAFAVWKNKFEIFKRMPINIKFRYQVALVLATMAVHDFIRKYDRYDDDFVRYGNEGGHNANNEDDGGVDSS